MSVARTSRHPGINFGRYHAEADEQAETLAFGFWTFLMSDLIIFGLMFSIFITAANPMGLAGGPAPGDVFNLTSVFLQTMILLLSSLTFGMAAISYKYGKPLSTVKLWLYLTLALGLSFLLLEVLDFSEIIAQGGTPARSAYWSAFFGLVPLHGLHVAAGCLWLSIMLIQLHVFGTRPIVVTRFIRLSLFWHFLDIVWIGVFSIVFLMGVA